MGYRAVAAGLLAIVAAAALGIGITVFRWPIATNAARQGPETVASGSPAPATALSNAEEEMSGVAPGVGPAAPVAEPVATPPKTGFRDAAKRSVAPPALTLKPDSAADMPIRAGDTERAPPPVPGDAPVPGVVRNTVRPPQSARVAAIPAATVAIQAPPVPAYRAADKQSVEDAAKRRDRQRALDAIRALRNQ